MGRDPSARDNKRAGQGGITPINPTIKPMGNNMNRRLTFSVGAAVLAGSLVSATLVRADQPNMQNALSQLQAAKASLEAASHNKGGHRENAIRLINQAIVEVQLGIDVAR
jgi:hypothetical protein